MHVGTVRGNGSLPAPAEAAEAGLRLPDQSLPGIIGAQLSESVQSIRDVMQEFRRTRNMTHVQISRLDAAVETVHKIALQSQQIPRLAGGRLRQSHERLSLDAIVSNAIDDRVALFQSRGIEVLRKLHPVEVIVDPGLLSSLVEAAIDWASELGLRIMVYLEIKNWPEHAVLVLKASQSVASGVRRDQSAERDSLDWYLLVQISQVMGVKVQRIAGPDHSIVMIEFPRTVRQLEGLTAIEVDGGGGESSSFHSFGESRPMAGHRVLLVTADARLHEAVKSICRSMGLVLDCTPSTLKAIRFCELDKPHMLVIDERLRDAPFEELRDDLMRMDINFPFVEIASDANTVAVSSWMNNSMSRVSRDSLATQLPSLLLLELAKAT